MYATSDGIMFMSESQAQAYCEDKDDVTYSHLPTTMIFNIVTGEWE